MNKKVNILECTIRDGSYAIDYNFNLKDVAVIGKNLEEAGFKYIEIGHGMGLGGSLKYGKAIASDEEYCKIAASVFNKAKWGMFFIPGVGKKEDLDMVHKYGAHFVRIGTNVEEIEKAKEYIKHAKNMGMMVTSNLMKSYAVSPKKFRKYALLADKYGVDVVYLVDSAGGMLPEEIKKYIKLIKNKISCGLGFHGHNNLSMAVANSIEAVKQGCSFVDSSLQGLGRSSGNAETEILAIALDRNKYKTGIDILKTLSTGRKLIKPLLERKGGLDELDLVCGYAQFHSSFMNIIKRYSEKYQIDPRKLIIETTKISKTHANPEIVESLAKNLKEKNIKIPKIKKLAVDQLFRDTKKNIRSTAEGIAKEVNAISKKENKVGIFTISFTNLDKKQIHFPFLRENSQCVIGNVEVSNKKQISEIIKGIDGIIDYVFLDIGNWRLSKNDINLIKNKFNKSKVLVYDDTNTWIESICMFMLLSGNIKNNKVLIVGINENSKRLIMRLLNLGFDVTIWDKNKIKSRRTKSLLKELLKKKDLILNFEPQLEKSIKEKNFIIGMTYGKPYLQSKLINFISKNAILIDGSLGSIDERLIELCNQKGNEVYRFDVRAGLFGSITTILDMSDLIKNISGRKKINELNVVAGGIIGRKGDVVVDSISNPKKILGVADGKGHLITDKKKIYSKNIKKVQNWIIEHNLNIE